MTIPLLPWPYASKPVIQWEHFVTTLRIWITFRYPMNTSVMPPLALWATQADGTNPTPNGSSWVDENTLVIWHTAVAANPGRVMLAYSGPDENLRITWGKIWENWGKILGVEIPYNWQGIVTVDVDNARVNINGVLALTTKIITPGTYNNMDISDVNILFLNCAANPIVLQGFTGGVIGQYLKIARISNAAQNTTLVHAHIPATQKLLLHAGMDETMNGEFGGWTLLCEGSHWYDVSHAKHV